MRVLSCDVLTTNHNHPTVLYPLSLIPYIDRPLLLSE